MQVRIPYQPQPVVNVGRQAFHEIWVNAIKPSTTDGGSMVQYKEEDDQ